MNFRPLHAILFLVIFTLCQTVNAQIPTRCFEISNILADACGSPEGQNEMVRIQVGPSPLNTNHLSINWPNNSWRHFCTDQVKIDSLNATIVGCGYLLAPPGGILPAGSQALIVTSTDMNVAFNSFTNLSDTIYMLFQCAGNTAGHFVNYSSTPGIRTLIIADSVANCGDTVQYDRSLLVNINGVHGGNAALNDGASIAYSFNNTASYYNNGCNAPFVAPSVNAGNDTTYVFCTTHPIVSLHGTKVGGVRYVKWAGGNGTFSQSDSLNTTYTPSPTDISPFALYLYGKLCPDTLRDTIMITITPPVSTTQSITICQGNSYTIGTHTYNATGVYRDTLLTIAGCDSVVTSNITMVPFTNQAMPLSGCNSVTYNGTAYTSSTSFQDTLRGSTGCDSIHYAVTITVKYSTSYNQTVALCQGQSLNVGPFVHSTAGTYRDTLVNAVGCDSIVTSVLSYSLSTVDAGSNATICKGDSTQLQATGGLTYSWTPATGLSNPNVANPWAKPTSTTTYTVSSTYSNANQIVNGDFSSGNTGFSSSYNYTSPTNIVEGEYTVTNNAQSWNGGMASCGDHTTGSGNMMVVNGAVTANVSIYCQTVNVVPGTDYAFSTWLQSVSAGNPAQLQFSINGGLLGSVFTASLATCQWQQFYTTWNSGTNISAQICIVNQNTIASGNDFALDDISFAPLCTATDTVQIVVNPTYRDTVTVAICGNNAPYTLPDGTTTSATGVYTSSLLTVNNCDSIIVTRLTVDTVVNQTINLPPACGQVTYGGNTYTLSTTLNQTLQYQNGCDSVIRTVNITVNPIAYSSQSPVRCLGQTFAAGSHTYNASGTYLDTISGGAVSGCDNIVTTILTIISPTSTASSLSGTCSITYNGQTYTSSTSLIDTTTSQITGCDSIYNTVTISVTPVTTSIVNKNVCINTGQTYFAGGQNQSTAGVYLDTVRTPGGCDSTYISTDLQVITPLVLTSHIDSCSRATVNGVVYTSDAVASYTLSSVLGCDSVTHSDTIRIHSPQTITITADQTLPLVEGDSAMLIIAPQGTYYNVVWTPDSNINSVNTQSPTVTPKSTTTYSVAAVDSNNCSVSGSINITVTPNTQNDFIMPTAFSPNGDGINDLFKAILRNGATVTMFHIYNRWGELIYDKDRDNSDGWEGHYKNVAQPIGVYVYFISVKSVSGKTVTQQGNLTLLR